MSLQVRRRYQLELEVGRYGARPSASMFVGSWDVNASLELPQEEGKR
jgi:hypothetical protein